MRNRTQITLVELIDTDKTYYSNLMKKHKKIKSVIIRRICVICVL